MTFKQLALCCAAALAAPALAGCPDVDVKADFDPAQYLGQWYETYRLPVVFEYEGVCVTPTYSLKDDGHVLVDNKQRHSTVNGTVQEAVGDATIDADEPAKLAVTFSKFSPRGPYWVLDTDYESFSFVLSCEENDAGEVVTEDAWLLSRTPTLDGAEELLAKYAAYAGLDETQFLETVQGDDCDYSEM